eukprot:1987886-Pyramimonas_sp.AAC.2
MHRYDKNSDLPRVRLVFIPCVVLFVISLLPHHPRMPQTIASCQHFASSSYPSSSSSASDHLIMPYWDIGRSSSRLGASGAYKKRRAN